jgi:hypothetical protein
MVVLQHQVQTAVAVEVLGVEIGVAVLFRASVVAARPRRC